MMMENDVRCKLAREVADFYESKGAIFSSKRTWPWDLMRLFEGKLKSDDLLVDVGAGNGRLADILSPDVRYLGIEPSASLRHEAAQRLSLRGPRPSRKAGDAAIYSGSPRPLRRESISLPVIPAQAGIQKEKQKENNFFLDPLIKSGDDNRKVVDGSLPEIDLPDNCADVVACIAVLHHIPSRIQRATSVQELYRILKPEGCLILSVWNLRARRFWSRLTFKYAWLRLKGIEHGEPGDLNYPWKAGGQTVYRYVHAFTLRELKSFFDQRQWSIEKIGAYDRDGWCHWLKGRNLVAVVVKR